jgi:hypothetical protein
MDRYLGLPAAAFVAVAIAASTTAAVATTPAATKQIRDLLFVPAFFIFLGGGKGIIPKKIWEGKVISRQ